MGVALGPRPTGDLLPLDPNMQVVSRNGAAIPIPSDVLAGLLGPFNGRAREILVHLLGGSSMAMAAATAGLSKTGLDTWRQRDPEFGAAVTMAYDMGFAASVESYAYQRAFDPEDRASGRLLELILKARSPDYREKSQLQLEVVRRIEDAGASMLSGWAPVVDSDSTEPA